MSETPVIAMPFPDAEARGRIEADLDTNLLVEAGAGSGKTTELVERMVALVETGCARVDEIAAVTFTRKAAGELRERFQTRLEQRLARASEETDASALPLLRRALDDIDRGFIGTIHAFCARLLRERPLDVGLDPAFQELPVEERLAFRRQFWESYLERVTRDAAETLEALSEAGVRPGQLYGLFDRLVENPDVEFPAPEAEAPAAGELGPVRAELDDIVSKGLELMDAREPDKGWDSLQKKLRTLAFTRDVTGWAESADFFHALSSICKAGGGHRITKNRWKDGDMARALCDRVDAFGVGDTPARRLVNRWYAHRYALAIRFVLNAAEDFAEHRRRSGRLDFQDLLLLTARLLRTDPRARSDLGRRYRRLLVDEFQDTDPLQAEVMMLLAADPEDDPPAPGHAHGEASGGAAPGVTDDGVDEAPAEAVQDTPSEAAGGPGEAPEHGASDPDVADWRWVTPRPGALFVVGDPKQSIYRFRRADIQLYDLVKRRFAEFGAVLELTMNFRSRPPIGDLVNQLFDDPAFFPPTASQEQAGFEPLVTRPRETSAPAEGVFWYEVEPRSGTSRAAATGDDAFRLATWIGERVRSGDRQPGDFMILTRTTHYLATYARALEAHGIPVQVSGAGVGVERELRELVTLLSCMIDPTHPVKVVAVLVGLFFGLDHERLLSHRLAGGSFDVVRTGRRGDPEVLEALDALHAWWRAASREPADVFVGRVVSELGLLPLAAAGELGSIRAGALRYALDAVRAAALAGAASLPGALNAMQAALDLREAEAPLEPSLPNVVRLMNLHQAKGLESPVVVLADPSRQTSHAPDAHVERADDGTAVGYLCVKEARAGFGAAPPLAQPEDWEAKAEAEARFEAAEAVRLLYVAVTRARDELVVARWLAKPEWSAWSALDPWLEAHATRLELVGADPAPPEAVALGPDEATQAVEAAAQRVSAMARPSFRHVSVTSLVKGDVSPSAPAPSRGEGTGGGRGFRGYSWGSAVHGALAAASADPPGGALLATCRALLVEQERPLDDHGDPVELAELIALVRAVRASELWRRAQAAPRMLAEVPFAATGLDAGDTEASSPPPKSQGGTAGRRQLELFAGGDDEPEEAEASSGPPPPGPTEVLEGVIDLAFREDGGWVIADYKTDVGTDPEFTARVRAYRRQVDLYARAWAHLTGEPVKERVLFFTSQGRMESW